MKLSLNRNSLRSSLSTILALGTIIAISNWKSVVYGDILITASESKSGVSVRWSGYLDVSHLESVGVRMAPQGSIFPKMGMISGSTDNEMDVYFFDHLNLRSFGSGGGVLQTGGKGDCLLLSNTAEGTGLFVCVPKGYSGEKLSGEVTFEGANLSSLGIDSQSPFSYDLGNQFISFFQGPKTSSEGRQLTQVVPSRKDKKTISQFAFWTRSKSKKFKISTKRVPSVQVRPVKG